MSHNQNDWPHAAARVAQERPLYTGIAAFFLLVLLIWALWPSDAKKVDEARIASELVKGDVVKIAEAPDGATVWAVQRNGETIYFSKGAVVIPPKAPDIS